jgi:hypothetical protein
MTPDERLARYRAEVGAIDGSEYGHVVFTNLDRPDVVVQVATSGGRQPAVIEATPNYDGENARLTTEQRLALAALGFDVTAEPYPSRPLDHGLTEAIDLFEPTFVALGSAPDFRLGLVSAENAHRVRADPA